jgi:hypothetical protein
MNFAAEMVPWWVVTLIILVGCQVDKPQDATVEPPAHPESVSVKVSAPRPEEPKADKWRQSEYGVSKLDDSKLVVLTLPAENTFTAWPARAITADLMIKCDQNQIYVYVQTETAAQPELGKYDEYTAFVRFNKAHAFNVIVDKATSNDALFLRSPSSILYLLAFTDTFIFQFTPFQSPPATIEFDTRGLHEHLAGMNSACPKYHDVLSPLMNPVSYKNLSPNWDALNKAIIRNLTPDESPEPPVPIGARSFVHDSASTNRMYWSVKCKGLGYAVEMPVYFDSKQDAEAMGYVESKCPEGQ